MISPRRSLFGAVSVFLLSLIIGFGVRGYERHIKVSDNPVDPSKRAQIIKTYGQLPLRFEANRGQTDARVKFISRNS
ncbi:MAG TPA: hypothetical protein VKD91_13875, partial [Pyrinomonadaceae bacterium]|nr:hypothetical protein [Pyrinomonadaceae bacterium]